METNTAKFVVIEWREFPWNIDCCVRISAKRNIDSEPVAEDNLSNFNNTVAL